MKRQKQKSEIRRCRTCPGTFITSKRDKTKKTCGKDCPGLGKNGINPRHYSRKRRAIMLRGDDIDRFKVFEMAKWICSICDNKIDKALRFPDRMAATIEHIIPLSKGGTHTWDNVTAAHADCNFKKGNRLEVDFRPVTS